MNKQEEIDKRRTLETALQVKEATVDAELQKIKDVLAYILRFVPKYEGS